MRIEKAVKALEKRLYRFPLFYPGKNPDAVRWAIMGLGNMAEVFATALDVDKRSRIVGVASRSLSKAQKFASRHGRGRAYGSYQEMLSDPGLDADVIYIATPARLHAEHIRMCLESGKSVLCEKPIGLKGSELEPLMALARERGLFLMEGMWMKCLPTFRKAKQWLEDGRIGKLELVRVDFYKRERVDTDRAVFNEKAGGGVLGDFGIYALAFVTAFLGGVPELVRKEQRNSFANVDADWQIFAERNGIRAFVNLSSDFDGLSKAALIGDKGSIEWDSQFNRTNRIVLYDERGVPQEVFKARYMSQGFEFEIEEVNRCLKNDLRQSECVSLAESLAALQLMDALRKQD